MGFLKLKEKTSIVQQKIESLSAYLLFFLFIVIGFSFLRNVYRAKAVHGQIEVAKKQLAELQLKKNQLRNELDEIQSREYLDKEAHDKLNLVYKGEVVLVLPEEDVLRRFSPRTQKHKEELRPLSSWQAWLKLFW